MYGEILVLAPHTDDGELGCGGTIAKMVERGATVTYIAFSTAEKSVPSGFASNILETEVRKATACLGVKEENLFIYKYEVRKFNYFRQEILELLVEHRNKKKYDLILLPSINDLHQDHSTIAKEGLRAFKNSSVLCYELSWNNIEFKNTAYEVLDNRHYEKKVEALNCYDSQKKKRYFSLECILAQLKYRGLQIDVDFAECFEVLRLINK